MTTNEWVPLLDVVKALHHPNFYWGSLGGFMNCKYLELRIDTRDNKCLVRDRDGKEVDFTKVVAALQKPVMAEMNQNPQIEIRVVAPGPEGDPLSVENVAKASFDKWEAQQQPDHRT